MTLYVAGILYRAMVLCGRSPDSISLRNKMNVFSSTRLDVIQTCSIRKFDGPRKDNFKRKILGSSVRKRFRVRSLSRCPLHEGSSRIYAAFVGGRRDYELPIAFISHRRHQSDSGGGYEYSYIIVPLAIVGTVIASMLPR
jgi:hypothetical protein